ncbi:c-type cytochrome [Roseibium sp.]|uniref:c-type cytochrome n=1 Tax=Roseibium sp. TaxID=1936156 RepID=UPI003D12454E
MKRLLMAGLIAAATMQVSDMPQASAATDDTLARGEYLVTIMDCGGCHTPRGRNGAPIAEAGLSGGNIGFEIPGTGIFWPPNLTPAGDGLGDWSTQDIVATLRTGTRPDGRALAPVMPWPAYARLTDEDIEAIAIYLQAQPPAAATSAEPVGTAGKAVLPFYRVTMPAE